MRAAAALVPALATAGRSLGHADRGRSQRSDEPCVRSEIWRESDLLEGEQPQSGIRRQSGTPSSRTIHRFRNVLLEGRLSGEVRTSGPKRPMSVQRHKPSLRVRLAAEMSTHPVIDVTGGNLSNCGMWDYGDVCKKAC